MVFVDHYSSSEPIESPNKITLPHKTTQSVAESFARRQQKQFLRRQKWTPIKPEILGAPIISSKYKRLNHYEGQRYPSKSQYFLTSGRWRNNKSKGDYFTINYHGKNPAFAKDVESFASLNIPEQLLSTLTKLGYKEPTFIQQELIRFYLNKTDHCLCTAETGSGKTLAYLLPVIVKLITYGHPSSAIVIAPSRQLAMQIMEVARTLCSPLNVNVECTLSNTNVQELSNAGMIITTPGILSSKLDEILSINPIIKHVILDEADTLLDETFNKLILDILQKISISYDGPNPLTRLIFVAATIPPNFMNVLSDIINIEDLSHVSSEFVNCIMPHVPQRFMRILKSAKPEKLLELTKLPDSLKPALIFFNNHSNAVWGYNFLRDNNVQCSYLSKLSNQKDIQNVLRDFKDGLIPFLCCTDMLARGTDTFWVKHVINYDFPWSIRNYIHRCGRVGRVGHDQNCLVTNLISNRYEVDLVQKIEMVVYSIFIINKFGSSIFYHDYNVPRYEAEYVLTYPLDVKLVVREQSVLIETGFKKSPLKSGLRVVSLNGLLLSGTTLENGMDIFDYIKDETVYPITMKLCRPLLSSNEQLILAGIFHSLCAISRQMSPVDGSSGIQRIEAEAFTCHCFEALTGVKFLALTDKKQSDVERLLRKIYVLYTDYALKDPFYSLYQPIRSEKFLKHLRENIALFETTGKIHL